MGKWGCAVSGCKTTGFNKGTHLFTIPKNAPAEIRDAWLRIPLRYCGIPLEAREFRICNLHFEKDQIITRDRDLTIQGKLVRGGPLIRWRLEKGAIPTIFPSRPRSPPPGFRKRRLKTYQRKSGGKFQVDPTSQPQLSSYCCFCFKKLPDDPDPESSLDDQITKEKMKIFKKFVTSVSAYLNVDASALFVRTPLGNPVFQTFTFPADMCSLCEPCVDQMQFIAAGLAELELTKLKLEIKIKEVALALAQDKGNYEDLDDLAQAHLIRILRFKQQLELEGSKLMTLPKVLVKPVVVQVEPPIKPVQVPRRTYQSTSESSKRSKLRGPLCVIKSLQPSLQPQVAEDYIKQEVDDEEPAIVAEGFEENDFDNDPLHISPTPSPPPPSPPHTSENRMVTITVVEESAPAGGSASMGAPEEKHMQIDQDDEYKKYQVEDKGDDLPFTQEDVDDIMSTVNQDDFTDAASPAATAEINFVEIDLAPNHTLAENVTFGGEEVVNIFDPVVDVEVTPFPAVEVQDEVIFLGERPEGSAGPLENPVEPPVQIKVERPKVFRTTRHAKKVAYMSTAYVGQYKVVCKLKNLQTGEECVGVVGKTVTPAEPTTSTGISDDTAAAPTVEDESSKKQNVSVKVLSFKKPKPPRPPSLFDFSKVKGPPWKCPLPEEKCGCGKEFKQRMNMRAHVRHKLTHVPKPRAKAKPKEKEEERKPVPYRTARGTQWRGRMLRCEVCSAKFWLKNSLHCHMKSHSQFPAKCFHCEEMFDVPGALFEHELNHVSETTQVENVGCPRCDTVCVTRKNLRIHFESIHLKIKKKRYGRRTKSEVRCADCGNRLLYDIHKYVAHRKRVHGDEGIEEKLLPEICSEPTCGLRYPDKFALQRHLQRSHSRGPGPLPILKCLICKKSYISRQNYMRHVRSHTTVRREDDDVQKSRETYPCEICGKIMATEGRYWNHKLRHSSNEGGGPRRRRKVRVPREPKPPRIPRVRTHRPEENESLICPTCGKDFESRPSLNRHISLTHNRTHEEPTQRICDKCGRQFGSKGALTRHILRHHEYWLEDENSSEQNPAARITCQNCGKRFQTRMNLTSHRWYYQRINGNCAHPDTSMVMCDICGKEFKNKGALMTHILFLHKKGKATARKIYSEQDLLCGTCGKKFKNRGALFGHIYFVHKKGKRNMKATGTTTSGTVETGEMSTTSNE